MNKLETVILDNGLTLYLYQDLRRHSTFFQFNTYLGGITKHFKYHNKEYNLQDGVAHILEHYLVEYNDRGNFLNLLGTKQMNTNASTSLEITNYYFETVENVCFGIHTMLDGIYHVTFNNDNLEKIKKPIYQEIRGRKDNKFYHASRERMTNIFKNIDFVDIGGTLEEVENTTIEDLEVLYKAFYHPKNQFIVIAGNFDRDEVLNEINSFYNTITLEEYDTELIPYNEPLDVPNNTCSFSFETPMDYAEINFKIDLSNYSSKEKLDLDFYINSFLASSFGMTSPLYKYFVDNKIIFESIQFSTMRIDSYLLVIIGAYTTDKDTFKKYILDEVNTLNNLDEEKFNMDKDSAIVQIILRDEDIFKMIFPFINNIIYYDYPYLDTIEDIENMNYNKYIEMIKGLDFTHYLFLTITKK